MPAIPTLRRFPRYPVASKKILIDTIGVLLIALVMVVGYKLSPYVLPTADITIAPEQGCDLNRGVCTAVLPQGGKVSLSLTPRPIPMVAPLRVEVVLPAPYERVEVDFAGVDMNMGLNRPRLEALGDGRYQGEATLPVCVSGKMDWQATLLLEQGRQRVAIPFRFVTEQH